jgi:hypothetical protein
MQDRGGELGDPAALGAGDLQRAGEVAEAGAQIDRHGPTLCRRGGQEERFQDLVLETVAVILGLGDLEARSC